MPPAKSLLEHCLHGTFRSRRHHPLLAGPRLPWPSLASLQVRYVSATSEPERRAIGLVVEQASRAADKDEPDPFERAVVDLLEAAGLIEDGLIDMAATLASALDVDVSRETLGDGQKRTATRGLTPAEFWYAGMGPGFGDWTGPAALGFQRPAEEIDWDGFLRLERRWRRWNGRYGCYWRTASGIAHNLDKLKLHRLLTGTRREQLDVAEAALAELRAELKQLIADREPLPDPPGCELLGRVVDEPRPRRRRT
jgi:hypothetical protein